MIERWGRRRMLLGYGAAVFLAVVAVLPPLVAIAHSFEKPESEQWSSGAYSYVLETYAPSLLYSLEVSLSVVMLTLLVAAPAAYAFVRLPFPGSRALEQLAVLPLTLPGVSVAVALIVGYSSFRGNPLLLVAAQMLYTVPYVVRVMTNSLRNIPLAELEDAARTLGARRGARYRRVVLPLLVHPMMLGSLIAFAISWGEFNVTFLLATPSRMPFAAALYQTYTSNSAAVAGAATAIFVCGALPFLFAFQWLDRHSIDYGQGV